MPSFELSSYLKDKTRTIGALFDIAKGVLYQLFVTGAFPAQRGDDPTVQITLWVTQERSPPTRDDPFRIPLDTTVPSRSPPTLG